MHAGSIEHFGVRYEAGDVIGCFIDVKELTISKDLDALAACINVDLFILIERILFNSTFQLNQRFRSLLIC